MTASEWSSASVRSVADVRVSSVDKKFDTSETPVRLCNYNDVYANDYIASSIEFMRASAGQAEIDRFSLKLGDVVITKDSETPDDIGVSAVVAEHIEGLVCGYHLALLRPKNGAINSVYLAKQLRSASSIKYFATSASGTTRFGLAIAAIEDMLIPLAPRPEQDKIADVLVSLDRAIEQTEQSIAKQRRIRTGLIQDLLTRGLDQRGCLRTEATHEFRDSAVGRIPAGWAVESLNDCVDSSAPICYGILMPGRGHDNGVPVIKVKDIQQGRIVQGDLLLTDPRIDSEYRRSRLRAGDLLVTIRGTTGRVAAVPPELDQANITQDTARLRLASRCSSRYFRYLLQSSFVQDQISLHTIGQAVKGINIRDVKQLVVVTPDYEEQEAIADRLEVFDALLDGLHGELRKLKRIRAGTMHDLLTGARRVTALLPGGR